MNLNNNHWAFCAIHKNSSSVIYYDSMFSGGNLSGKLLPVVNYAESIYKN